MWEIVGEVRPGVSTGVRRAAGSEGVVEAAAAVVAVGAVEAVEAVEEETPREPTEPV